MQTEIRRLLREIPLRPFAVSLENGDRIVIEHPENIAFDPGSDGSRGSSDFYVISRSLRVFSTFEAVTSAALLDAGEQ